MFENCRTAYQFCRKIAPVNGKCLTQEEAAPKLYMSVRKLAGIEEGETIPKEDDVEAMIKLYDVPMLAWWHTKHHSVLGKFLPDVPELSTLGDMILKGVITKDRYNKMFEKLKGIAEDFKVTCCEKKDFEDCIKDMETMSASLLVMAMCGKRIKIDGSCC